MTTATRHRYIVRNDAILSGEPIIAGTRTPVRAIVETWRLGIAPEDIPHRLPHLTLAQVFDALSHYSDHQDEVQYPQHTREAALCKAYHSSSPTKTSSAASPFSLGPASPCRL